MPIAVPLRPSGFGCEIILGAGQVAGVYSTHVAHQVYTHPDPERVSGLQKRVKVIAAPQPKHEFHEFFEVYSQTNRQVGAYCNTPLLTNDFNSLILKLCGGVGRYCKSALLKFPAEKRLKHKPGLLVCTP